MSSVEPAGGCPAGDACFHALIVYQEAAEVARVIFFRSPAGMRSRALLLPHLPAASAYLCEAGLCVWPAWDRDDG